MILVPDMLAGMSVKGSKDADVRLVSKKSLKQKRAHWIGAQSQVKLVKNSKTCPLCEVTKRKLQTQIK